MLLHHEDTRMRRSLSRLQNSWAGIRDAAIWAGAGDGAREEKGVRTMKHSLDNYSEGKTNEQ
jgi:hypothetical protein